MEKARGPSKKVIVGGVSAAIWEKSIQTEGGKTFAKPQVVLDRVYRDSNGKFATTSRLDVADVPKAILALTKAYESMCAARIVEDKQSPSPSPNDEYI